MELGNAGTDGCVGGQDRGAGGVGIDPEVDIPQDAQLGFEHDVLPCFDLGREIFRGVADVVFKRQPVGAQPIHHLVHGNRFVAVALFHGEVLPFQHIGEILLHALQMFQVSDPQGLFHVFVGVHR